MHIQKWIKKAEIVFSANPSGCVGRKVWKQFLTPVKYWHVKNIFDCQKLLNYLQVSFLGQFLPFWQHKEWNIGAMWCF